MVLTVYSIRHYIIKYIDMIIINYDYRIFCLNRERWWFKGNIYVLPKIRYDKLVAGGCGRGGC